MSDPIVGIDLGTSNTVVAHADAMGNVRVLADASAYKIHPSVVSFHPNGGVIVGAPAKQRKVIDPQNTIYSVKRLIGRAYSSPEVKTAMSRMPYKIKEGDNELPLIVTRAGEFAVPEISAIVLDHVRNLASSQLGAPVTRGVVTVPASFNDAQRSATATAGAISGLTVVRVLNEPTAAALAYGNTRNLNQIIAVYDFGGGTFDITILKLHDQVYEVLGTSGDTFLGGDDLDERLVDKMVHKFLAENRVDLRTNEVSMMRLRAVAEQTKIELSRRSRAVVRVDEIAYGPRGKPLNLHIEITRDEFVAQVAEIIDQTFPVCQEAMRYAELSNDKIDDVILVGGTTKIPYVRDQVSKFFGRAPRTDVNPEDAVAVGAALQATSLERILQRSTPAPKSAQAMTMIPEEAPTDAYDELTADHTRDDLIEQPTIESTHAELMLDPDDEQTNIAPAPTAAAPGRRHQPSKAAPRTDTEYSVPRIGARDEVFNERPAPAGAIARLRPRVATPPPTPVRPPLPRAQPARAEDLQTRPAAPQLPNSSGTLPLTPSPGVPMTVAPTLPDVAAVPTPVPSQATTLIGMEPPPPPTPAPALDLEFDDPLEPNVLATEPVEVPARHHARAYPAQAAFVAEPVAPMPVIMEVTPRGLGIATVAGFCEELIRRNSRLPAEMIKLFTTSRDQQDAVRIVVCQGESRRLDANTVIGDLRLEGLPPRPRGETSIEVTFALDASGVLQVRARDAATGHEQRASLDLVGGLRAQDVAASRERIQQLRR